MVLACDIGNSYIHFGLFKDRRLVLQTMFATREPVTQDECFMMVKEILGTAKPSGMVIASVVPNVTPAMKQMAAERFALAPIVVDPQIKTGLIIKYRDAATIGADRIANAVGAWVEYKQNTVVVDFGTATTYDVVTKEGEYLGGVIVPGIGISLEALIRKTARLFKVDIAVPRHYIGQNTEECIQSGIFYSTVGQVETIVKGIEAETGRKFLVIATGGAAQTFGSSIPRIEKVDPFLTLKGLLEIYYLNR
jgi:type III pantothenate kinase